MIMFIKILFNYQGERTKDECVVRANGPDTEETDLRKMYDYFNVNDNVKLQVFVDVMLYFGRRRREKNFHALKICDFAATTDSDGEVYIYLTKDEQTKNHQDDPNSAQGRMYTRKDDPLCPVKSFMMYKRHLNPKCSNFFQRPSKGESPVNWYTNAPVVTMLSGI